MSYPGTLGGAVPISTSSNREPPPADLFTSPSASAFEKDGIQRARRSYISVHFVYGVHHNYTNNCALACSYFGGKTPPPTTIYGPGKKNLEPAQNAKI